MTQEQKTEALLCSLAPDSAHSDEIAQRYASHALAIARKLDSDALLCAAFRAGYEAGYMHAGPKGLALDEVVPSSIEIAAIRAAAEAAP